MRTGPHSAIAGFGMDTITLAGPLEAKLEAMAEAGFSQVMLKANDLVGHPGGVAAAVRAVRNSGLRGTGFQVLRDFEGLSGHLHQYKVDIAKSMLEMCAALDCKVLLAVPLGIKIAFEGLSWGRTINEYTTAWDVVCRADCPNLGLGIDAYHIFAAKTPLDEIDYLDPSKIFLVQLADFMWQEVATFEERRTTARTFRVFPGEGVHTDEMVDLVLRLDRLGYRGDYSFEVFNDDYVNLPLPMVVERAKRSALWLAEDVLRRSVPLPNQLRLKERLA